jgi:hypothetical protein
MHHARAIALLATLALSACATPIVYMPASSRSAVGFSEYRIEADRYRVTFTGGNGAPEGQVADYALLRAAELTLREGYDWFRVVDRETDVRGDNGPRVSVGGGSASFGRRSSIGVGLGVGFDLNGGPALSRTIEVMLGRGEPPRERGAYDARDVVRSIGPRARGPGAS